jgi:hypothetical protein
LWPKIPILDLEWGLFFIKVGKSNHYDNIADIYDQTRWLTESLAGGVADFILELVKATPETSFLEPGVGTGLNVISLKRSLRSGPIPQANKWLNQYLFQNIDGFWVLALMGPATTMRAIAFSPT